MLTATLLAYPAFVLAAGLWLWLVRPWLKARRQVRRRLPVHWLTDEERRRRARRWS